MAGGLLQLVANSGAVQNLWLDHDPQITFFKKIYRRHTPFALESVPLFFKNILDFGGSGNLTLLPLGDLVHRIFFVFDIPSLAAMFLNTKSQDIMKIINSANIVDDELLKSLQKCATSDDKIEFDRIFNLIDDMLEKYDYEEKIRLNILREIEIYKDPQDICGIIPNNHVIIYDQLSEENLHLSRIGTNEIKNNTDYDFNKFKIDLANHWIFQKKEYFLIHEFLKFIYLSDKQIIENVPLVNTENLGEILFHCNIFYELIPNKEILFTFYLKNLDFKTTDINSDNLLDIFNSKLCEEYNHIFNNSNKYKNVNKFYCLSKNILSMTNYNFPNNPLTFDMYNFLKKNIINEKKIALIRDNFYDFGPYFFNMLNAYNTVINIVKNLATTIPIVAIKPLIFSEKYPHNIYIDNIASNLQNTYLPMIIDPNFKEKFILSVNKLEKPNEDVNFIPIDYIDMIDQLYPNKYINAYLNLFNSQTLITFDNIRKSLDVLFNEYYDKLF